MFRKMKVVLLACLLLAILSGTVIALESPLTDIYVIEDSNEPISYRTAAITVAEFLQLEGLELSYEDIININLEETIQPNMIISIRRAVPINLVVDGQRSTVRTAIQTVGDFVEEYEAYTERVFVHELDIAVDISAYMDLELKTKEEIIIVEAYEIPFTTEIVETNEFLNGEVIVHQNGSTGIQTVSYGVTLISGEETERVIISDEVTLYPIIEIIKQGTARAVLTEQGYKRYIKRLTMSATAYSLEYCCTGKRPGHPAFGITASGMRATEGVVAVDPRVIPLGTRLYIEGYGLSIAGDTGGAVRGNVIDLFFYDHARVIAFGRQTRNVYILE